MTCLHAEDLPQRCVWCGLVGEEEYPLHGWCKECAKLEAEHQARPMDVESLPLKRRKDLFRPAKN